MVRNEVKGSISIFYFSYYKHNIRSFRTNLMNNTKHVHLLSVEIKQIWVKK